MNQSEILNGVWRNFLSSDLTYDFILSHLSNIIISLYGKEGWYHIATWTTDYMWSSFIVLVAVKIMIDVILFLINIEITFPTKFFVFGCLLIRHSALVHMIIIIGLP